MPTGHFRAPLFARFSIATIALVALGALIVAGCGDSDDTKTLNVISTAKGAQTRTVDLGPPGKSAGDIYVFDNPLLDSDEQKSVGHVYGTQTSIGLQGDTEIVQAMITFDFGDGDRITVGGMSEYPRGATGLVKNREFVRPILGGTGDYAGVRGTLTTVRRSDNSYEQTFQIED